MIENYVSKSSDKSLETYSLQNSMVKDIYGNWVTSGGYYKTKWANYNCYAYSINRGEQPSFYTLTGNQYEVGDMADDEIGPNAINTFTECNTILDLAELVEKDLLAMGYSNITITDYYNLPISSNQELICVRIDAYNLDYHFMRYDSGTNAWYHKPGASAVLKYNFTPFNTSEWTNEGSINGVEQPSDTIYNGQIKFIKYTKNMTNISSSTLNNISNLSINVGKDVILEINNNTNNNIYEINANASYGMNIELYDDDMNFIESHSGSNVTFYVQLVGGKHNLKINYSSSSINGILSINISSHNHLYGSPYTWLNYNQHKATCICGNLHNELHVVSAKSLGDGLQYVTCILCGGPANAGIVPGFKGIQITESGSFISPNGTLVLADEDIDNYLAGEIVFEHENIELSKNINIQPYLLKKDEDYLVR